MTKNIAIHMRFDYTITNSIVEIQSISNQHPKTQILPSTSRHLSQNPAPLYLHHSLLPHIPNACILYHLLQILLQRQPTKCVLLPHKLPPILPPQPSSLTPSAVAKMFFYPTGLVALLLAGKSLMENYKAGHDVEKDPTTTIDEVQNLMARQLQLRKMGVAEHESSSREE